MQEFDRHKIVQLGVGIAGVYLIYSYAGLLQEAMYMPQDSVSNRATSTMRLANMTT